MAAKTGLSAGRLYLQVVPSYKGFMEQLRKDAPQMAKELSSRIDRQLQKESGDLGKAFGQKLAQNVAKGMATSDGLDGFSRELDRKLKKAIDTLGDRDIRVHGLKRMREELRQSGTDVEQLDKNLKAMARTWRGIGDASGNQDGRRASNLRQAADAILGVQKAEILRGRAHRETNRDTNVAAAGVEKLRRNLIGARNDSQDGANAFRFFNFAVLALAGLGPALIPMFAALAGGLALLGPILLGVGAGVGVAVLAFSGLGDAVKALADQQDATSASSTAYARSILTASRAVADARRGVADATRSAAEANRNALRAQEDAEKRLARAQRDASQAQRDLTEARKEAKRELADLDNQIAQNALDERQGVIDLFNAYNRYGAVMSDGGATNLQKEEADIGLQQSELNLKRIREEQKRLAEEKAKADKGGLNGTSTVQRAEERLTDALERQKEAREDLAEASRRVDRTRADGARSVANAQRNLTRAQEDYNYALQGGATAVDNVNKAMGDLSPAGREFARFLFEIREGMIRLRKVAQEGMLPGVQEGLQRIIDVYAPGMYGFIGRTSELLGKLSAQAGQTFTNPVWREFFRTMGDSAQVFIEDAGRGTLDWLTGFASLATTAAPYAERLSNAIAGMAERFRDWAASTEGTDSVTRFLDYVERVGPKVTDFFGAFGRAMGNLGAALGPIGESVLSFLTDFLDAIAKMDPAVLGVVVGGVLGLVVALQLASGLLAVVSLVAAITGAWVLLLAAGFIAVGAAVFFFARSGGKGQEILEKLRKAVQPVWDAIKGLAKAVKDELVKTFNQSLRPALEKVGGVFAKDLLPALGRFLELMSPLLKILIKVAGFLVRGFIAGVADALSGLMKMLSGLMDFITGVFTGNWRLAWDGIKNIFSGFVQAVWGFLSISLFGRAFGLVKGGMKTLASLFRNPIQTIQSLFLNLVSGALKKLRELRDKAKEIASAIGNNIKGGFKTPFKWIVDNILNKVLIGGINKLAGWVGLGKKVDGGGRQVISPISTKGWATGGWTGPGAKYDVAGVVHADEFVLSKKARRGLEAFMPGALDYMNQTGRWPGYAKGGRVWPANTKALSANYPGHSGIDIAAKLGSAIKAALAGVVSHVGYGRGFGKAVFINGEDGLTQIYGHTSRTYVRKGAKVKTGARIADVGYTGNVRPKGPAGAHLHFEIARQAPGSANNRSATFDWLGGAKIRGNYSTRGESIVDGLSGAQLKALKNPIKWLSERARGPLGGVSGIAREWGGGIVKKIGTTIAEGLRKKIADALGVGKRWFSAPGQVGIGALSANIGKWMGQKVGGADGHNLYDNGGYLQPGLSMVMNRTGRPEPVLTGRQWDAILAGRGGDGESLHLEPHFHGTDLTASDVTQTIVKGVRREKRQIANRRRKP